MIRIGLWFGSLLLSVTLFGLLVGGPALFQVGSGLFKFRSESEIRIVNPDDCHNATTSS